MSVRLVSLDLDQASSPAAKTMGSSYTFADSSGKRSGVKMTEYCCPLREWGIGHEYSRLVYMLHDNGMSCGFKPVDCLVDSKLWMV